MGNPGHDGGGERNPGFEGHGHAGGEGHH
jgi:hypothetical protein